MYQRQTMQRYLTRDEERQLFKHVKKFSADILAERDWHWMQLLRQTGMRINNLANLTIVDAWAALKHPQHHLQLADEHSKGGQGYVVRFNTEAIKSLRALLRIRQGQGFDAFDDGPLIMSRQGKSALSVRSYQNRLRQWSLSAGLAQAATPHWFRHTLAKRIIDTTTHKNPLQIVQQALGHSDIKSTVIYTMPDKEEVDAAVQAAAR